MQRWIILPDIHIPYEDKKSLAAVEKYMAAYRWDGWLQLGDLLDLNELSSYVAGSPGAVSEETADAFAAGRDFLDRHAGTLRKRNKKCRMVLLEGNHEYRTVTYAEKHPGLKEHLDVPRNLRLAEKGVEWIPSWSRGKLFKLGHASFLHGGSLRKHTHAKIMVLEYGRCIYYGHTHDILFSSITQKGDDKTLEGGSLGCLCRYDQKYLKGSPTNWQQAVSTLYLQPNGNYNLYVSRIFNHKFVGPDGRLYG